jgi:hypothetical protein
MKHSKIFMLFMTLATSYASAKEYSLEIFNELNDTDHTAAQIIFFNRMHIFNREILKAFQSSQKLDEATLTRLAELEPSGVSGATIEDRKQYIKTLYEIMASNQKMKNCILFNTTIQNQYTDEDVQKIISGMKECKKIFKAYQASKQA